MKKPTPVHTNTICSVCGLDWDRHGEKPTPETCIELLQADLAREKQRTGPSLPYPYPVPYPAAPRYPHPSIPWQPSLPYRQPAVWISQPNISSASGGGGSYSLSPVSASSWRSNADPIH